MARSYEETLEFLFSRLPVFQRVGAAAYKPGLDTILGLCQLLGNPQRKFPAIHVAGTNGKGSTSHSLASVLHESGYKTGLYTSPHLIDFRERIRINGEMVAKNWVVDKVDSWMPLIDQFEPSFFELTVALAFQYFAENQVDIAIVEVGMGGRLDSTNIIQPLVSVITNIGYDHQKFLGESLPEIAGEKAGIIKNGIPVVLSQKQSETYGVFLAKSQTENSPLVWAEEKFEVWDLGYENEKRKIQIRNKETELERVLWLSLTGDYQLQNVKGVLAALEILKDLGWNWTETSLQNGLEKVQKNTGLMGRWQVLQKNPLVICDTAHNEDGIKAILHQISNQPFKNLWMVWGMVKDKDHRKILALLPKNAQYLITQPNIPRAMPAAELNKLFLVAGFEAQIFISVSEALQFALEKAENEDFIFIGGSTFTVADIPFEKFSISF